MKVIGYVNSKMKMNELLLMILNLIVWFIYLRFNSVKIFPAYVLRSKDNIK